ncbi:MAG: hypothetical protein JWR12_414 [Mucilaginibacter sp.]|nr:hypothetical protein [Mucilaginibacter sp.]
MDSSENILKEPVATQSNEDFHVLLKVLSRIELYILGIGVLFYFISASISWKFDVEKAQKMSSVILAELNPYAGHELNDVQLKDLERKIQQSLSVNKLTSISIGNFISQDTINKSLYDISAPTVTPDEISALEGISSWSRAKIDSLVKKQLDESTTGLDIYQFIVQGAFSSDPQIHLILFLLTLLGLIFITQGIYYYHTIIKQKAIQKEQDTLRKKVQDGKEASPVWELAQLTLNKYYNRNLSQNNWIFYVSVIVMSAGFGLVLYGITLAYKGTNNTFVTIVSTSSGVIVQFIGATFLVIYNSTISQAIQYTASLQRVSAVGTSMKILDSIKNDETEEMKANAKYVNLMIAAKIEIAKLLIDQSKKSGK